MENKEKKIGTATIDINEYDRLNKIEDKLSKELSDIKKSGDEYESTICKFLIDLTRSFIDSHLFNPAGNDAVLLDRLVGDAGYTINIIMSGEEIHLGNGKKSITFRYAKM
jgi:hypothetical protein